jgi:hypothetical protein
MVSLLVCATQGEFIEDPLILKNRHSIQEHTRERKKSQVKDEFLLSVRKGS